MKISGFTFVRNAEKYDYPVKESITSILPIVDEFIVCLGNSADKTLELIQSINSSKIKIFHSTWDESLKTGGRVLAVETDKAMEQIAEDSDWAFYLQADEVVHEKYLQNIQKAAELYKDNDLVEGLLFKYLHFYGTYDYVGDSRRWYNREIRIVRNDKSIKSYKDAQGFRKNGLKLHVKPIDAYIYHYGWVKAPDVQMQKHNNSGKFWGGANYVEPNKEMFDYFKEADSLINFNDTHPQVMKQRIEKMNWKINFDVSRKQMSPKDRLLYSIEKLTGKRLFDYRNYRII